MHTAPGFCTCS